MLDSSPQRNEITQTLRVVVDIFSACSAEYRILGSVLVVAYANQVFRKINDIDILLDARHRESVFEELERAGFRLVHKKRAGFRWVEAQRDGYMPVTFMLVGDFLPEYFRWRFFGGSFELRIRSGYLTPTVYVFDGVRFIGLPLRSVIAGLCLSSLNPKRDPDREVLAREIRNISVRVYGNISVYVLGVRLPYVYDFFSLLNSVFGRVLLFFGKDYHDW